MIAAAMRAQPSVFSVAAVIEEYDHDPRQCNDNTLD